MPLREYPDVFALVAFRLRLEEARVANKEVSMAKGQQKSNREVKKPKASKATAVKTTVAPPPRPEPGKK